MSRSIFIFLFTVLVCCGCTVTETRLGSLDLDDSTKRLVFKNLRGQVVVKRAYTEKASLKAKLSRQVSIWDSAKEAKQRMSNFTLKVKPDPKDKSRLIIEPIFKDKRVYTDELVVTLRVPSDKNIAYENENPTPISPPVSTAYYRDPFWPSSTMNTFPRHHWDYCPPRVSRPPPQCNMPNVR